jgi:DNA-binding XRE family transcriptional regulator
MADQIGVDEDTIYHWESNESIPQVRFIPTIIKLLGYNPFPLPERITGKAGFSSPASWPEPKEVSKENWR